MRIPPRAYPFLLAALHACARSGAGEPEEHHLGGFKGPESCRDCHPQHYQEWRGSPHAYATVDPLFRACNRLALEETGGKVGGLCVSCHTPLGVRTGEVRDSIEGTELSPLAGKGVSCEVCHRMEPPREGKPVANASFELESRGAFFGPLKGAASAPAHESVADDFIGQSAFCGSCHDVMHDAALLEKAFAQWSGSVYPERSQKCQDCHMVRYSGQAAVGGPFRQTLRRHNFPAVSVPLVPFPNRGRQEEEVQEFLRTAARMVVAPPSVARAGADLPVEVRVKNSGAGHNIPTGLSSERQMWIEVTAVDGKGGALLRSGHLDEHGDLMDGRSQAGTPADPSLVSFSDRFLDDRGGQVTFLWQASRLEERSLRPLEERRAEYRIPVPSALEGSSVRIRVRLLFRPFAPYAVRALGLERLAKEVPVWEMARFDSEPIPVLKELPREVLHRVPEDFPDIASAIEAARDGDTVLVGPGEHSLLRTLDFGGRSIRVRSRRGAERTTLRLRAASDAKEASVIAFRGGEGPEALLEGFTITGGRGTEAGGVRRGGGIYIDRSSPTISGNRIVDDETPGGEGGGIYCRDGRPVLAGNSIQSCRARSGGGLAFAFGAGSDHPVTLKGCSIQGNFARDGGGGLFIEGGWMAIERCVVAGNLAGTEGGGVWVSPGARFGIDHSTFAQNRARRAAGALFAGAPGRVRATNSIFWDNAPPGCAPPSCDAGVSYSILDRKAAEGSTNLDRAPGFFDPMGYWERAGASSPGATAGSLVAGDAGEEDPGRWVGGDYRLLLGSPAIDAGDPEAPADPDDSRTDIGALFFEMPLKAFVRADVDGDGKVELRDLGMLVERLLFHIEVPCLDAADVDDDGRVDCLDVVGLARYLLTGRPTPAPPFGACGLDPTSGEGLTCARKAAPCRG